MKSFTTFSDYDPFAKIYNRRWGQMFLPRALAVIDELLIPVLPKNARILDLCCGTGQMARELSSRGYKITGLDGSREMLKFARENAPSVKFILDDARSFKLSPEFDAVISVFDSLNHILELEELTSVFNNVYDCLKTGGLFLFDMTMKQQFLKNFQGYYGIAEDDMVALLNQNYNRRQHTGTIDFTAFLLEDGNWKRTDFKMTQKWYSLKEILSALKSAGFKDVNTYTFTVETGLTELTEKSWRGFYLCRKA
jgi:SAM-dependent methyltransferase